MIAPHDGIDLSYVTVIVYDFCQFHLFDPKYADLGNILGFCSMNFIFY